MSARRAIKTYLIWGSVVVMAAYLWATFGNMVTVPVADNNSTTGILTAVQTPRVRGDHRGDRDVVLRLEHRRQHLLVQPAPARLRPGAMGRVHPETKVPVNAVLLQTIVAGISALAAILIYAISEYTRRREMPTPETTPVG